MDYPYDAPPDSSAGPPRPIRGCRAAFTAIFVIGFLIVFAGFGWMMWAAGKVHVECRDGSPAGVPGLAEVARAVNDVEIFEGYGRPPPTIAHGRTFSRFDGLRFVDWRMSLPRREPGHAGRCDVPLYPVRAHYVGVRHFSDGSTDAVDRTVTVGVARRPYGGWETIALQ